MRLIDVNKLTDGKGVFSDVIHIDFRIGGGYIMVDDLLNILDNQPTAYDVDKVVEELQSESDRWKESGEAYEDKKELCVADGFKRAIEIVKSGDISKE